MLGETENWRVLIDFPYPNEIFLALHFDRFSLEGWAVSGFVKKLGIGSPSQSSFRFFYLGACKVLGKTENRQVWIDFPYPNEIFLALHFDRFCLEI